MSLVRLDPDNPLPGTALAAVCYLIRDKRQAPRYAAFGAFVFWALFRRRGKCSVSQGRLTAASTQTATGLIDAHPDSLLTPICHRRASKCTALCKNSFAITQISLHSMSLRKRANIRLQPDTSPDPSTCSEQDDRLCGH